MTHHAPSGNPKSAEHKLTNHAKNTLRNATAIAQKQNCDKVENFHLFYAIFLEKGSMGAIILRDLGIKKAHLSPLEKKIKKRGKREKKSEKIFSAQLQKTLAKAFAIAQELHYGYVGTEHLIYSLLDCPDENIKVIIGRTRVRSKKLKNPAFFSKKILKSGLDANSLKDLFSGPEALPPFSDMSPEKLFSSKNPAPSAASSHLEKFCININEDLKDKNETIIGRQKETARMITILGRKNKNNPLLIGPPGVGKTALVMKMAQLINGDEVPPYLRSKKIMSLDVAALIAGTSFRGEFEMRLKEIIKEIASREDVVLFIDEIHNIVGAGNIAGSLDLANIIKPAMSRGEIKIIGATTFKEYKQHIEKDAALERRFQPISVAEPSIEEARQIMFGVKPEYEKFHNVSISDESINLAVDLGCRYIQERFLPDKAIDVLDEAASRVRSQEKISEFAKKMMELKDQKRQIIAQKEKNIREENYEQALELRTSEKELEEKIKFLAASERGGQEKDKIRIEGKDIVEAVAHISGVPQEKLEAKGSTKIKNISRALLAGIIGQKEAVRNLSSTLLRTQLGIGQTERPLGSFLFLGPTGVGKTLTAKVLAREFFASEKNLVRIDMSEFMERHSVSALIGSPAGYIGYGEGGRLTEKVRRHPYSVVLFDEIEKAHPDVFNILLQILDEGILTDAQGLEVSFKNTVIILTTNIGTEEFNEIAPAPLGFQSKDRRSSVKIISQKENIKKSVLKELEDRVRPEILNRLDHVLVFNPLTLSDMRQIAQIELVLLGSRLKKLGIKLVLQAGASQLIARASFAKNQGARLIRKNIQEMVENGIADLMVKDKVKDNKIMVSVGKGKIKIA